MTRGTTADQRPMVRRSGAAFVAVVLIDSESRADPKPEDDFLVFIARRAA